MCSQLIILLIPRPDSRCPFSVRASIYITLVSATSRPPRLDLTTTSGNHINQILQSLCGDTRCAGNKLPRAPLEPDCGEWDAGKRENGSTYSFARRPTTHRNSLRFLFNPFIVPWLKNSILALFIGQSSIRARVSLGGNAFDLC